MKVEGAFDQLFVFRRKPRGKRLGESVLIKCGDCKNRLEIYNLPGVLEINGVAADKDTWARVLIPLLAQHDGITATSGLWVIPEAWAFTSTNGLNMRIA